MASALEEARKKYASAPAQGSALEAARAKYTTKPGIPETIARNLGEGLTFNFSGELAGVGAKIGDWLASKKHGLQTNPNAFREGQEESDARLAETVEARPELAYPAQILGGLAMPLPGVAAVKGATTAAKIGKSAAVGAGSGALAGAGSAKTMSDIPESAAVGGLVGGALGGAIPAAPAAYRAIKRVGGRVAEKTKDIAADKAVDVVADMLPLPGFAQRMVGRAIKGALNTGRVKKAIDQSPPVAPKFQFGDDAAAALKRPRLVEDSVPPAAYEDGAKTLFRPKGSPTEKNLGADKIYTKPPKADISSVPRPEPESFDEMFRRSIEAQDAAKAREVATAESLSDAKIAEIMAEGGATKPPFNPSVAPSKPLGENEVDHGIRSLLKSAQRDAAAREASGLQASANDPPITPARHSAFLRKVQEGYKQEPRLKVVPDDSPEAVSIASQLKSILARPGRRESVPRERFEPLPGKPVRMEPSDEELAELLLQSLRRK